MAGEATKKMLKESLERLLLQKPYRSISVRDLTEDSGISRSTFYYHFKSVDILLEWIFINSTQDALQSCGENAAWQDRLYAVLQVMASKKEVTLNVCRSLGMETIEDHLKPLVQNIMIGSVRHAVSGKRVREEDILRIADFFRCAVLGSILEWVQEDMAEDPKHLTDRLGILMGSCLNPAVEAMGRGLEETAQF